MQKVGECALEEIFSGRANRTFTCDQLKIFLTGILQKGSIPVLIYAGLINSEFDHVLSDSLRPDAGKSFDVQAAMNRMLKDDKTKAAIATLAKVLGGLGRDRPVAGTIYNFLVQVDMAPNGFPPVLSKAYPSTDHFMQQHSVNPFVTHKQNDDRPAVSVENLAPATIPAPPCECPVSSHL